MRYLYYYYKYIKELSIKRNELNKKLENQDSSISFKILDKEEKKKKIVKAILIGDALFCVFSSLFYSIGKDNDKMFMLFIYALIALLFNLVLLFIEAKLNNDIKIIKRSQTDDGIEKAKKEYQVEQEKIYDIAIQIICINENYYDIKKLTGKERIEYYKKICLQRRQSINEYLKYNITPDRYNEYLENWIAKNI